MEVKFCRRCGQPLKQKRAHVFICPGGHTIYQNASPATAMIFVNDKKQALVGVRAADPGKGRLAFPGGFCDGAETFEDSLYRELKEELGLSPDDYETPKYLMSALDTYDFGGETHTVLTGIFWANIKPSAKVVPADDVAKATFMTYDQINPDDIQFKSQVVAIKRLHADGIL